MLISRKNVYFTFRDKVTFHELAQKFVAQVPRKINDKIVKTLYEDVLLHVPEFTEKYSKLIFPRETRQVKIRLTHNTKWKACCKIWIRPLTKDIELIDPDLPIELHYEPETEFVAGFVYIKNVMEASTYSLANAKRLGKIIRVQCNSYAQIL